MLSLCGSPVICTNGVKAIHKIMQHNLLKHGFSYCGIIYLLSGDERLAYQRI